MPSKDDEPSGGDLVADAAQDLAELLPVLQELLPEPVADPTQGSTSRGRHRTAGSPAPWHAEAAAVLMTIYEGVRRMEASIRQELTGQLGQRRGGSDANTAAALAALGKLAYGLPDKRARHYARRLNGWVTLGRTVHDVDQAPKWKSIHTPRGQLPPTCPYCRTYSLRVAEASGAVRCVNPKCVDSNGQRPYGRMEYGEITNRPLLAFADGREITYYGGPDLMTEPTPEATTLWITTHWDDAGQYRVTLKLNADMVRQMNRAEALTYAAGVVATCERAEHDAAVVAQLRAKMKIGDTAVAQVVSDLREIRGPLDPASTAPLRLGPGVSQATGEPFVSIFLETEGKADHQIGQWTPADARGHATHVLSAVETADLDTTYRRYLIEKIALDPARASAVTADLIHYRTPGE